MGPQAQALFAARDASDRDEAYRALVELFAMTERPVPWAYDVWDGLLADLTHKDGHKRSFAAQMLERLAISDPEGRMLRDFPRIVAVTKDERFVTARHALESLWRVALAGPDRAALVADALEARFRECLGEKNAALTRTDVIAAMRRLAAAWEDGGVEARALALIDSEPDEKARKKQLAAWRKAER